MNRPSFPRLRFGLLSIAVLFGGITSALADSAADARRLVEQLGSERFSDRAAATRELQRLGRDAIPQLVAGVRSADAETRRRSLYILRELASSDDVADADAVFTALTTLAAESNSTAQSLAEETLRDVRKERAEAAIEQLRRLGADVSVLAGEGIVVQLRANWHGTERDLALLSRVEHVQRLSIEDKEVGDQLLEHVAELSELEWLYIGSSRVTGKALQKLAGLTQLRTLSLRKSGLSDADFLQLPAMPNLEALGLDGTQITDVALDHLADFPAVRTLWLDDTNITSAGLSKLVVLSDLSVLYLSGTNVSGPGLAELHKLPELRSISLKNCALTPDDMERLSGLNELDNLGLDHTSVSNEHLLRLDNLPKLRTLWLSKCPVTDEAVDHLARFNTLQTLYLHGSEISEHGAKDLKKALPECQVLR
jgi:hypothetical protein